MQVQPNVFDGGSQMNTIKLNDQSNIYSNIYDTTERDQQGAQMKKWLEETNSSNPLNLFKNMSAKNNQLYNDVPKV